MQEELNNRKEQEKVRGTVITAELVGDSKCPSLISVSVYDTKPVHFLSMSAENIKWVEKKREVYDRSIGRMTTMKFLRLNVNDEYNYGMGGVDIADQIRGSYRFDHWLRNYKWWHAIFWWGFQVLMVNAYKCYSVFLKSLGEVPMPHYKFQKMIAHAWMDKDYYSGSKQDYPQGTSSLSTMSSITTPDSTKRSRVSVHSLMPITGSLKHRLNNSLGHWPCATAQHHIKKSNCQLHYWATGKRKYSNVAYCKDCRVSLCTDKCYEAFHTVWDIESQKESMRVEMEQNQQVT